MIIIIYFFIVFLLIVFLITISLYLVIDIIAHFVGGPYVPTKHKAIDEILKNANLKKNQKFYELGSGDGRVIRQAVKKYQVKGIAVEINPLLYFYSKLKARIEKIKNISFKRTNFFKVNLKDADVIFVFLMPHSLKKLKEKFFAECKKNTLIISHGFKIENWEKYLIKTLPGQPFSTYYYRFSKN